jgi:hypothetical protein
MTTRSNGGWFAAALGLVVGLAPAARADDKKSGLMWGKWWELGLGLPEGRPCTPCIPLLGSDLWRDDVSFPLDSDDPSHQLPHMSRIRRNSSVTALRL